MLSAGLVIAVVTGLVLIAAEFPVLLALLSVAAARLAAVGVLLPALLALSLVIVARLVAAAELYTPPPSPHGLLAVCAES